MAEYFKDKAYIAFDSETDGVDKESKIIGISACSEVDVAYYVILSYWDTLREMLFDLETTKYVKEFLETLVGRRLIMQNAPFDCSMVLNNYGIDLMPSVVHDTMIGGHVLNENRHNGLKERGVELFGEDARAEQEAMKESVTKNGGVLTKSAYELYKADSDLLAHYGAKDALLTLKVFYNDVPQLFDEGLDKFFYEEESMPLLRGPTYDMNNTGLRVDVERLQKLKGELEAECMEAKAFIHKEIWEEVKAKYPGTGKTNHFNIGAPNQLSWLLFIQLGNLFNSLTKSGRELCDKLDMKIPYSNIAKRDFIRLCTERKGQVYAPASYNPKTKKMGRPKKIGDPWVYMECGKESLEKLAHKYKWVARLIEYKKNLKLLNTYVEGIQTRMKYGVIRPNFLQHGTTSGRYSCKNPNFQNLPRDDKRIKSCIVSRPDRVFVGADYAQLEPRVFASFSQDQRLMDCFSNGEDFYSVIGVEIFDRHGYSLFKDHPNSFAKLYPSERQMAKVVALATPYGTSAFQMARTTGKTAEECQEIIDNYFERFPNVYKMMLDAHNQAKIEGCTFNLFGRPRRIPAALDLVEVYGNTKHANLPKAARHLLNLGMNHIVQSTGASIVNRAAIAFYNKCKELEIDTKIVLQVHDEIVVECLDKDADTVVHLLKDAMENTVVLPGVKLVAEPKVARNLGELK